MAAGDRGILSPAKRSKLQRPTPVMFEAKPTAGLSKAEAYRELATQLTGLLTGERNGLANAANTLTLGADVETITGGTAADALTFSAAMILARSTPSASAVAI